MLVAIIGCEIAFWGFVLCGLTLRYRAGRPRAGAVLLACAPLSDLALLVVAAVSLRLGAAAHWSYGLAAVYLGVSVVFGRDLVATADRIFANAPARPRTAMARTAMTPRAAWRLWLRAVAAGALSALLLLGCLLLANEAQRSALQGWLANMGLVIAVWLVHPVWRTCRPDQWERRERGS